MNKQSILNLDDTAFILWCQEILKEKCKKDISIDIKLIPYLKDLVKKYYDPKKTNITITETIPKNEELPTKIVVGSSNKKSQIFIESPYAENQHLTEQDIANIDRDIKINIDKDWVEKNNKLIENNIELKLYTHHFDELINGELRSENSTMTEIIYELTSQIIFTLNKSEPYPKKICLYRGVGKEYTDNVLKKMKIGDKIINKGFSSQTINIDVATEFIDYNDNGQPEGSIMMLCYPSKSKFLYLETITQHTNEFEMLSYPNNEIKLIDMTEINIADRSRTFDLFVFSVNNLDVNLDSYNIIKTYDINEYHYLIDEKLPKKYKKMVDKDFVKKVIETAQIFDWFDEDELTEDMVLKAVSKHDSKILHVPDKFKTPKIYAEAIKYYPNIYKHSIPYYLKSEVNKILDKEKIYYPEMPEHLQTVDMLVKVIKKNGTMYSYVPPKLKPKVKKILDQNKIAYLDLGNY